MNARQAAKHYKKKYKELEHILSVTTIQPHITYTHPDIIQIKTAIQIPSQKYCITEFEYEHRLTKAKSQLILKVQEEIIPYIQIERQYEYIPSPDFNTYMAKIDVLDRRNY